ncbi:MAG: response regulator [Flavobacterium sp.]
MEKNGPIIIIEDDADDREIISEVIRSLSVPNEIVLIGESTQAMEYLRRDEVRPFMVISDINMPKLNGFALRDMVLAEADVAAKCTPYLFFTTAGTPETVREGYRRHVHGFFHKINDYSEYCTVMGNIIAYWKNAATPLRLV